MRTANAATRRKVVDTILRCFQLPPHLHFAVLERVLHRPNHVPSTHPRRSKAIFLSPALELRLEGGLDVLFNCVDKLLALVKRLLAVTPRILQQGCKLVNIGRCSWT